MAAPLISVSRLNHSIAGRTLMEDVTLGIEPGSRIGLIGDNGAGKSTLLKLIAGTLTPDGGEVFVRSGLRISVLEQVPKLPEGTIEDALRAPLATADGPGHQKDEAQYLLERAASSLGIHDLSQTCAGLSGGYQKRVALARMLLEDPEVVLLDEPTNHLDTETVAWLERWLGQSTVAAVVVTHDRYFLDLTAQRMAELRGGQLRIYKGNYSDYLAARAMEEAQESRTDARTLRVLSHELDWARRAPQARTTKNRARLERLEVGQATLAAKGAQPVIDPVRFGEGPRLGKTILGLSDVIVAHPGGRQLFEPVNLELSRGERWGIIGPNGAGKTTLLRLLTGALVPSGGHITRGTNTQIAYFDQHRADLDPESTVRAVLVPTGGDTVFFQGKPLHVNLWLGRFAFPAASGQMRVKALSGGERNRLALAKLMLTPANLLLLDEPTNDLDLLTLGVLEEALQNFQGCIIVVSHDRYFLDKIATHTLALTPGARGEPAALELAAGGYSDLMARRKQAASAAQASAKAAAGDVKKPKEAGAKAKKSGLSYKDNKELAGMEAAIETAETQMATLEAALADPNVWQDAEQGKKTQADYTASTQRVSALYARWQELLTQAGPQ